MFRRLGHHQASVIKIFRGNYVFIDLKPVLITKSHSFTYKYWVLYKIVILNEVWPKNLHLMSEM